MGRLTRFFIDRTDAARDAREERECQRTVFAVSRAVRNGRCSRRQFAYARRDLFEARERRDPR
jgi:hypothetical protein